MKKKDGFEYTDSVMNYIWVCLLITVVLTYGVYIDTMNSLNFAPRNIDDYKSFLSLSAQIMGVVAGFLIAVFAYLAQGRKPTKEIIESDELGSFIRGIFRSYSDLIIIGVTTFGFILFTFTCMVDYSNTISVDPSTITSETMAQVVTTQMQNFRIGIFFLIFGIFAIFANKLSGLSEERRLHRQNEENKRIDES